MERDPYDLTALEEVAAQRIETSRQNMSLANKDLVWLMSGPRGRRFIYRIIRDAGLDTSSFSTNAMEMARQEGRKEIARGLRRLLDQLCPDQLVLMMKENSPDE